MTETHDARRSRQKRIVELDDLKVWLAGLDSHPHLHVNGPNYATAVLTVDFGTPLEEAKLNPDVTGELVSRLRDVTKVLCKDANVRVQNDTSNGIWWSSVG